MQLLECCKRERIAAQLFALWTCRTTSTIGTQLFEVYTLGRNYTNFSHVKIGDSALYVDFFVNKSGVNFIN